MSNTMLHDRPFQSVTTRCNVQKNEILTDGERAHAAKRLGSIK